MRVAKWKRNCKCTAFADFTFDSDGTAVLFDKVLYHRKAEACALHFPHAIVTRLGKGIEYQLKIFLWNTRPRIPDLYYAMRIRFIEGDFNFTPFGEFHGIADQV